MLEPACLCAAAAAEPLRRTFTVKTRPFRYGKHGYG